MRNVDRWLKIKYINGVYGTGTTFYSGFWNGRIEAK
jgi:hypothetical protein